MSEKEKIKTFLDAQGITKNKFYTTTGLSIGFLDSGNSLGVDKLKIIISKYPQLSLRWLVLDEGEMIETIRENSGVIINGDGSMNNSTIDNRHYYSDSPDVLRAQIECLDERIKEKDAQIKEKDAQIRSLLDIMQGGRN